MDKLGMIEDISFLLYLSPLLINGLYALYLWFTLNLLPVDVYLKVTNDNIVFLAGVFAILIALVMELWINPKDMRIKKIGENISRMRILAFLFIILSLISVWSASGYSSNIFDIFDLYLEGRYAISYPLFLLFFSFALSPSIKHFLKFSVIIFEVIPIILIASSPLLLYIFWRLKLSSNIVFYIPLLIFIAGIALFFYSLRVEKKSKLTR
ncbi:MAG: hypothetical protein H3Z54_03565 [archaeon]|nr:hypothetical protein [archaeon]